MIQKTRYFSLNVLTINIRNRKGNNDDPAVIDAINHTRQKVGRYS